MAASLTDIVASFRRQANFCRGRNANFTATVIEAAAEEIESGGDFAAFFDGFEGDPGKGALALRVAGAMHALVLQGRGEALSEFYAAPDRSWTAADLRAAISALARDERDVIRDFIQRPPQTNEIRRASALLFGFCEIAERTGLPLDLCELGASGGLLLAWDRFRYEYGSFAWGAGDVVIHCEWRGPLRVSPGPVSVRRRAGCDLHPVDYADPEALLRARAYLWPEQPERRALFDAAVGVASAMNINVDKAEAATWLEAQLARGGNGATSVVYHSVISTYLSDAQRHALNVVIESAASHATADRPLALLSFEPEAVGDSFEFFVDLTLWPSGETKRLAKAHPHGAWVAPL